MASSSSSSSAVPPPAEVEANPAQPTAAAEAAPAPTGVKGDQSRQQLTQAADAMFSKIGAYMEAELGVAKEDYLLLQMMNSLVKSNYSDMSQLAEHLNVLMHSLQEKYETFQPYLNQIDKLDENVGQLEESARRLDEYSRQLEARFRKVLKV